MRRQKNTPYALLGLLSLEPMSGYDVRRELQQTMVYIWNESNGQIYPTLKRLASEGLIAPARSSRHGKRLRQAYAVTPKGRAHLRAWLAQPPRSAPTRNEFLLKFFLSRFAPPGATCQQLRRFCAEQGEKLAQFEMIRRIVQAERRGHPDLKLWHLMLDHGTQICRAEISWCDQALRSLCPKPQRRSRTAQATSRL